MVYCGDPGCGDSEDLAYNLQGYGFTKLYVFKGGGWSGQLQTIPVRRSIDFKIL